MAGRKTRVIVGSLLAAALLLVLLDLRTSGPTQVLRGAAGTLAGPPERALAWVRVSVGDRFGGSAAQHDRIAELQDQLAQARASAGQAAAGRLTVAEERELAALTPPVGYSPAAARVVSVSAAQDVIASVAISLGSSGGVHSGLAVLGSDGLAGITESVSPLISSVRLVVDPRTELAARVASSGEVGIFRGNGSGGTLTLLDPQGTMAAGDLVVTLGAPDATIPAGLPIGRIATVTGTATALDRAANVTPAVDVSTLDRVDVLIPDGPGSQTPVDPSTGGSP